MEKKGFFWNPITETFCRKPSGKTAWKQIKRKKPEKTLEELIESTERLLKKYG